MATVSTQTVGSHTSKVAFGQSVVPAGFLASFRKKKHLLCESGRGFTTRITPTGRIQHLCECAVPRAIARLKQVGAKAFNQLGEEWLVAERIRLKEWEASCEKEGREAPSGSKCPYPPGTDQFLAWFEGHSQAHPLENPNEKKKNTLLISGDFGKDEEDTEEIPKYDPARSTPEVADDTRSQGVTAGGSVAGNTAKSAGIQASGDTEATSPAGTVSIADGGQRETARPPAGDAPTGDGDPTSPGPSSSDPG